MILSLKKTNQTQNTVKNDLKELNVLLISDLHGRAGHEKIINLSKNVNFDITLCLGDLSSAEWSALSELSISCPLFSVCGNHDLKRMKVPGKNMHATQVEVFGLKMTGMNGSYKYKDSDAYWLLDDSESVTLANEMKCADVLLTHDSMKLLFGNKDEVHVGLDGISHYVNHFEPLLNVFGHYHINECLRYKNTLLICNYGINLASLHFEGDHCELVKMEKVFDPDKI